MSEIKFACPYCHQHITCDAEYCDAAIDCPACGNGMVVPRLSPTDSTHPETLVVASTPAPKPPKTTSIPLVRAMTESEWAEHSKKMGASEKTAPLWLLTLIATLIIAFVLQINRANIWAIMLCLVLGAVVSAVLLVKNLRSTAAYSVLKGLSLVLAIAIFIPVIAIGILFIGCMGCH
jgi:hypothetical protein